MAKSADPNPCHLGGHPWAVKKLVLTLSFGGAFLFRSRCFRPIGASPDRTMILVWNRVAMAAHSRGREPAVAGPTWF